MMTERELPLDPTKCANDPNPSMLYRAIIGCSMLESESTGCIICRGGQCVEDEA